MERTDPTGTVSRRPEERSAAGAFARLLAQHIEDRSGGSQQSIVATGSGEFREAGPEGETTLGVTADEPMVLQGHGESMHGRPGEFGR